jgi:hypothetical protein
MTARLSALIGAAAAVALLVLGACGANGADENEPAAEAAALAHAGDVYRDVDARGSHAQPRRSTDAQAEFHDAMRKLWEDHVTWTRLFIVSAVADLPDLQVTTERLLANQVDIGNAVKPYYGEEAGNQLTVLLQEHITTAAAIVDAAKRGDTEAVNTASASWYDNADRVARFLNDANPDEWKLGEAKSMMREHLDLTLDEAVAQLSGDYAGSVALYDEIHVQILGMADMLSGGIVAQFPEKFE